MANVDSKIPELREKFLKKYDGSVLDDTFDERDVEDVKKSDFLLRNTLRAYKTGGDVGKAVDLLNDILLFRAKYKLQDLKETDLHEELRGKNPVFYHGVDKKGNKILQFRVSKQKKSHLIPEGKALVAYYIYQHYKLESDQKLIFLFDFVDAGVSNMDMEMTKFIIKCASNFFPCVSDYNLMFKMGVALEAVWKMIKGFLDADQSKRTHFAKRSNLQEYIALDQTLPHQLKEDKK